MEDITKEKVVAQDHEKIDILSRESAKETKYKKAIKTKPNKPEIDTPPKTKEGLGTEEEIEYTPLTEEEVITTYAKGVYNTFIEPVVNKGVDITKAAIQETIKLAKKTFTMGKNSLKEAVDVFLSTVPKKEDVDKDITYNNSRSVNYKKEQYIVSLNATKALTEEELKAIKLTICNFILRKEKDKSNTFGDYYTLNIKQIQNKTKTSKNKKVTSK